MLRLRLHSLSVFVRRTARVLLLMAGLIILSPTQSTAQSASKTGASPRPSVPAKKPAKGPTTASLTEARKREIFRAVVLARNRAKEEARTRSRADDRKRYSAPHPEMIRVDAALAGEQMMREAALEARLEKKYLRDVERKYRITPAQRARIETEGTRKGWSPSPAG
jgi:hypothetical protein